MNFKLIKLLFSLFFWQLIFAQDLQPGFNFLESGNYQNAVTYFKNILEKDPENRTAKLCFGRAVGLNGNTELSVSIFTQLLDIYPNDFEIKLNYAESLLWNKNYTKAILYYKQLIKMEPDNFPVILGYANALSNTKSYDQAYEYINEALNISPENKNALLSKKYIQLGYANQLTQQQDFEAALQLLEDNLNMFDGDRETLLNIANVYITSNQLDEAEYIYKRMVHSKKDSIVSLNGLALIAHLKNKNKIALELCDRSMKKVKHITDTLLVHQTIERYIHSLIWNNSYREAEIIIDRYSEKHSNENWLINLRATLNTYKGNFKKGIKDYDLILQKDTTSFNGNLGKANALRALGLYEEAYDLADTTLGYYNNQKDVVNFIHSLDQKFTPSFKDNLYYSFDDGNNESIALRSGFDFPISTKFKLWADYGYKTTKNTVDNKHTKSNTIHIGLSRQLYPKVYVNASVGLTSVNSNNYRYSHLSTDASLNIKSFMFQDLVLGYSRRLQDFNAALLDRNISENHLFINYNISTNIDLGLFTQYYYTFQNDDNNRNLFFTSLYYTILKKPYLKVGINYQYMKFKTQVPDIYFSPEKFNMFELFFSIIKEEAGSKQKKWFYTLDAATGYQFIEDKDRQGTFRLLAKLGYKFSKRNIVGIYYQHSNIASSTASGFTYTELGIQFKWLFLSQPVFRNKKR